MPYFSFFDAELLTKEQVQKIIPYRSVEIGSLVRVGKFPPPIVFRRQHFWRESTVHELGLLYDLLDPVQIKSRMEVMRLLFLVHGINPAAADSWSQLALSLASTHVLPFTFSVERDARKSSAENLVRAVKEICRSVGADADV